MKDKEFIERKEFITAFQAGNEKTFQCVYNALYTHLCIYTFRIIKNEQEACDITQEAFIKLWEVRKNFNSWLTIRAYLYTLVRNAALNYLKFTKMKLAKHEFMEVVELEDSALELLVRQETQRQISELIGFLSPECGRVVRLLTEGKSYKEVSELLQISVHTVKNHRVNAMKILREKVRNFYFHIFF